MKNFVVEMLLTCPISIKVSHQVHISQDIQTGPQATNEHEHFTIAR